MNVCFAFIFGEQVNIVQFVLIEIYSRRKSSERHLMISSDSSLNYLTHMVLIDNLQHNARVNVPQIPLFESRRYSYSLLREKERKIDHSVFCPWFICIKMNNANFEKERMCKSFIRSIERTCRTIVIITSKIDDNVRRASLFDLQRNVNKPNIECFTNNSSCSILLNLFGMAAQGPC